MVLSGDVNFWAKSIRKLRGRRSRTKEREEVVEEERKEAVNTAAPGHDATS